MYGMGPRTPKGTGTRLHRQVWLKRSPRSLNPAMSRPSCCGSSLPTPPMVAMGQGMLPLQLRPPTMTSPATHPPLFTEAGEPLEAGHWLRVMESKFGLLHCTEVQKTLFATHQLWGDDSAWWTNYTASRSGCRVHH
jgi:hypothetical protein